MRKHLSLWLWLSMALLAGRASGYMIGFDQPTYTATPGADFTVSVLLDADGQVPDFQGLPQGLLSMGFKVLYVPSDATVAGPDAIVLPPEMTTDGLGGPALKDVGPGRAGAAAAVDLNSQTGYKDPLLATFHFQNTALVGYELRLGLYFSDPRMANFVDFPGASLDADMQFGSAMVSVVPEPGSLSLAAAGAAVLALAWILNRLRQRQAGPRAGTGRAPAAGSTAGSTG